MKFQFLLLDTIAQAGVDAFREFADVTDGRKWKRQELLGEIHRFEGLILKSNNHIDREIMSRATRLKVISRAGSGLDNIDMQAAEEFGIQVITSPEGNVCSVAEYVISMAVLLCHQLKEAHDASRRNDFQRHVYQGRNLAGLTVGVVGLGNIGTGVVEKISKLCKHVIGYDPYAQASRLGDVVNFSQVETLEQLLRASDVVTLHLSLTPESRHLFNDRVFGMMKDSVILINSSRGQIIDDQALLRAFASGKVQSAALDSLYPDPQYNIPPEESTYAHFLVHHPKVYYTPHIAAGTGDALEDVAINLARKVNRCLEQELQSK